MSSSEDEDGPLGDDRLAAHDAAAGSVDYRTVGGRRGSKATPGADTMRAYRRWLRFFQEWCERQRYQPELTFLTDSKLEEWALTLVTDQEDRPRYRPGSVQQALSAMRWWARKAAVHPMPSFDPAFAVLHRYLDALVEAQVIVSRSDRRVQPTPRDVG